MSEAFTENILRRMTPVLRTLAVSFSVAVFVAFVAWAVPQQAPAGPQPGAPPSDQPATTSQTSSASASHPNLAGTWKLNKDQSDDPRQKMQEAAQQNGGGSGWGGGGGGMGGGRRGGGQGGGQRGGGMMQDYSQLTITQTNTITQVTGDSGRVLASTDNSAGNSSNVDSSNSGNSADSGANRNLPPAAQWQGSRLVVTEQMRRGTTTRTYELSSDGKQLYVTTKIDNPRFTQPVTIRFVYDPAKQGG
jgi:hypothetical protein